VALQLHNSFGFQLSLTAYWEEQSWNLLKAPRISSLLLMWLMKNCWKLANVC